MQLQAAQMNEASLIREQTNTINNSYYIKVETTSTALLPLTLLIPNNII